MKNKKALVTGAFGFLGRNTALELSEEGFHVTGIGHGKWTNKDYQYFGIKKWYESDLTLSAMEQLREQYQVIVHCGGSGSVGYSIENPAQDFYKTVDSTMAVLEFIRLNNPEAMMIYPSSPAVQGNVGQKALIENIHDHPISPYGYHKLIAEKLCESYAKNFSVKISIIRFFSVYGDGLQKQLLWDACRKIISAEKDVLFFGTGSEIRDWIHVSDAVKLISKIVKSDIEYQIINCGSGKGEKVSTILKLIKRELVSDVEINFDNRVRSGDPVCYLADISKAISLGWKPDVKIEDGIKDYVSWFKGQIG